MLLFPKFLAGYSGKYVDTFGYGHFFTATALLGVPVLILVWLATRAMPVPTNSPNAKPQETIPSAGS